MTDQIRVPISPGELLDKLTILRLKTERIEDATKLANVRQEFEALRQVADTALDLTPDLSALWADLYEVNAALWQIEDDIRRCEARRDFGADFVALARAVYVTNDRRAAIKRQINDLLGAAITEEKSYRPYEKD